MGSRFGLLVGVGEHQHLGEEARLLGPANDVRAMADVLVKRFRFATTDVQVLVDGEATRGAILGALDGWLERADEDDQILIHWSGHGSQVVDEEGDEPDGLDETWVPFDARPPGSGESLEIRDDEIFTYLARFDAKGVFLTLILDCCHAGHAHRLKPDIRIRGLPPLVDPARRRRALRSAWIKKGGERRVVLAACRDDQLAGERAVAAGCHHGDWTWALLRSFETLEKRATFGDAFDHAASLMARSNPDQWPQIYGRRDRLIFGTETLPRSRFPRVHRQENAAGHPSWILELGAVHGLCAGSRWQLLEPGSLEKHGEAELTELFPFESRLRPLGILGRPKLGETLWARVLEPAYGEARLQVRLKEPDAWCATARTELEQRIENSPWLVKQVGELGEGALRVWPDLSLRSSLGQRIGGAGDENPQEGKVAPVEALIRRLERRAKARRGLSLHNREASSQLRDALSVELWRRPGGGQWTRLEDGARILHFTAGDRLGLKLRHSHATGLYVYVLDFGLTDQVTQIHPEEGAAEFLYSDLDLAVGLREEDELEFQLPDDFSGAAGTGFLKVFATTKATDFRWITSLRPPTARKAGHGLEELICLGRVQTGRRSQDDWTTREFTIRLHRAPPPMPPISKSPARWT